MAHILIVDDEPAVRRIMEVGITKAGYEVTTVPNGEVALSKLRARWPDVLITDIEMPKMDGRSLCESVRREFPEQDLPIFVLTSLTERSHRNWSAGLTDLEFLEKPVSMRILIRKIEERLTRQAVEASAK